jgi:hypothetical protein
MQHLSNQIHKFGVSLVQKYSLLENRGFEERKGRVIPHWIEHNNPAMGKTSFYPCMIFVKPHIHLFETQVTGRNIVALARVREKGVELSKPVIIIFVDVKSGLIYADFLGAMMKPKRLGALCFPKDKMYHGHNIRYFALDHLHVLFQMNSKDITVLKQMHLNNGTNENQKTIFE